MTTRPLAHSRQQAAGSRQQAAGSRQQTADSRQQTADSRQQTRIALAAIVFTLCACDSRADDGVLDVDEVEETDQPGGPDGESGTEAEVPRFLLTENWEPVAHPVRLTDGPIEDVPSEDDADELRELAEKDPTWRAADGIRYEALYVLSDGRAWGRRGPAPDAPVPPGVDSKDVAVDDDSNVDRILLMPPADRRDLVSISNLTGFPERTIGALNQFSAAGQTGCTGAKVGPRAILTASHCVMDNNGAIDNGGWFHPGQTTNSDPNGAVSWAGVGLRDWRILPSLDYAVLGATDTPASYNLGWMEISWGTSALWYDGRNARVLGYPGRTQTCADSPLSSGDCGGYMYRDNRNLDINAYHSGDLLRYPVDTTGGQSGSPVFTTLSGVWTILAVHKGYSSTISTSMNYGPRFRSSMYNDVCSWIAGAPSIYGYHPFWPRQKNLCLVRRICGRATAAPVGPRAHDTGRFAHVRRSGSHTPFAS